MVFDHLFFRLDGLFDGLWRRRQVIGVDLFAVRFGWRGGGLKLALNDLVLLEDVELHATVLGAVGLGLLLFD